MKAKFVALCILLSSVFYCCACGPVNIPAMTQEAHEAKQSLDAVADRLEQVLRDVAPAYENASNAAVFVCDSLGADSTVCKHVKGVKDEVDARIKGAEDAIKLYRETGQHFNDAQAAVVEAANKVMALKLLVDSLKKSIL